MWIIKWKRPPSMKPPSMINMSVLFLKQRTKTRMRITTIMRMHRDSKIKQQKCHHKLYAIFKIVATNPTHEKQNNNSK
jgi:hypothetical protein